MASSELTTHVAPEGLRWREPEPLHAELALKKSRPLFHLVGVVWNLGFSACGLFSSHPKAGNILPVAAACVVLFAVLFVRALVMRTRIRFDARALSVRTSLWGGAALDVPLAEIDRFEARHSEAENRSDVYCISKLGAERLVPIEIEPVQFASNGSKRALWSSPPEHARFVASRLDAMLAEARLLGHDTYRR